jgi:hypothetical protein
LDDYLGEAFIPPGDAGLDGAVHAEVILPGEHR